MTLTLEQRQLLLIHLGEWLVAKAQGVALARSYVHDAIREAQ